MNELPCPVPMPTADSDRWFDVAKGEWTDVAPAWVENWLSDEYDDEFSPLPGDEQDEPERRERLGRRLMQADGSGSNANGARQFVKRQQRRVERHRAKRNPECVPAYRRHRGWEL